MICPWTEKLCIHPNWADCQFEYAGDEPEYVELWLNFREHETGNNCVFLPKGISRTEMLESLGAFGEEAKRRVAEKYKVRSQRAV